MRHGKPIFSVNQAATIFFAALVFFAATCSFEPSFLRTNEAWAQGKGKAAQPPSRASAKLPRIVEIGAKKCIPCKMMAPILEELRKEYAGMVQVDFIDVWEDPNNAEVQQLRIRNIPTQVFFDASGKEYYRHIGFLPKESILAKFKEMGVPVKK
jgi:thioredoxin 1